MTSSANPDVVSSLAFELDDLKPTPKVLLGRNDVLTASPKGGGALIQAISAYEIGLGDFTLEAWFCTTAGGPLLALSDGEGDVLCLEIEAKGDIAVYARKLRVFAIEQPSDATDGTWHHLALTRRDGEFALYLDGMLQAVSKNGASLNLAHLRSLRFGSAHEPIFSGSFAEVRFWDRARLQADLRASMFYRLIDKDATLGYWTFVGRNLNDSSRRGNHSGQVIGSARYEIARVSYESRTRALLFSRDATFADVPGHVAYNLDKNDFTIETWVFAACPGKVLGRGMRGPSEAGFRLWLDARGRAHFRTSDGHGAINELVQPANALFGAWHHLAITRARAMLTLVIDGVAVVSQAESRPTSISTVENAPFELGDSRPTQITEDDRLRVRALSGEAAPPATASQAYRLQLSDVRFWRKAHDSETIYRKMTVQPHDAEPDLIGYWNFATGNVIDRSTTANVRGEIDYEMPPLVGAAAPGLSLPQHVLELRASPDSYMAAPLDNAFDVKAGDFTLQMRFRASQEGTLLSRAAGPTGSCSVRMRITNERAELHLDDGEPVIYAVNADLRDGAWHNLAWIRRKGHMACFLDMKMRACSPLESKQNLSSQLPLFVGAHRVPGTPLTDHIAADVDFIYLYKDAQELADLQRSTFESVGAVNLAAAWTFDQLAPIDQSLTRADGTLGIGAKITADYKLSNTVPLSMMHFSGVETFLDCRDRSDLQFSGVAPYTIAAWCSPTNKGANGTIYDKGQSCRLAIVGGVPVAYRGSSMVKGVTSLKPNAWYFIAMTYDGSQLAISVNGAREAVMAIGQITADPTPVTIGAVRSGSSITDCFDGSVQSAQVWSQALDEQALSKAMDTTPAGSEKSLAALWNFIYASTDDWTGNGTAAMPHKTQYRASTFVPPVTRALALNGRDAYVDCGADHALNLRREMTIEAWVRVHAFDTEWQVIAAKGSAYQLRRFANSDQVTFSTANAPGGSVNELISKNAVLLDGGWHHIAATFDGKNKRLYIDGNENASNASGGIIDPDDRGVLVGDTQTANVDVLRTFAPRNGRELKRVLLDGENAGGAGIPVLAGKGVVIMRGDRKIVAVDTFVDRVMWRQNLERQGRREEIPTAPTIYRNKAYISEPGRGIVSFDVESGKRSVVVPGETLNASPAIRRGLMAYFTHRILNLYDLRTNRQRDSWSAGESGLIRQCAFIDDDTLIVRFSNQGKGHIVPIRIVDRKLKAGAPFAIAGDFQEMILDGGVVYARAGSQGADAGKIFPLRYNREGLTLEPLTWSQQYPTPWSYARRTLGIEEPYAAAIYATGAVAAFNTRGEAIGRPGIPGQRTGVQIANDRMYLWNKLSLEMFDLTMIDRGVLVRGWSTSDMSGARGAPVAVAGAHLTIGARMNDHDRAEAFLNGLISEVRLWETARTKTEIAATWQRRLIGNERGLRGYWPCAAAEKHHINDLSTHRNAGRLRGAAAFPLVDLGLEKPLPYIVAQARMMPHWSPQDVLMGNKDGNTVFRTEIHVYDGNRQPVPHTAVRIWTDEEADLVVEGVQHRVDPRNAALLSTDGRGIISVVIPCKGLTSPTLQVWADSMPLDYRVIIHPDDNLNYTLRRLSKDDLVNPSKSGNPLLSSKEPFRKPGDWAPGQAEKLADAVRGAAALVERPIDKDAAKDACFEVLAAGPARNPRDNAPSHLIQLRGPAEYTQTLIPGKLEFDVPHKPAGDLTESKAVITENDPEFADLWTWFVEAAKQAVHIVVDGLIYRIKIIVDKVVHTLESAFKSIVEAGEFMLGLLRQAFRDVVNAAEKIYQFFSFIFNWTDILETKTGIVERTKDGVRKAAKQIDKIIEQQDELLNKASQQFDVFSKQFIASIGDHSLDEYAASYPQQNPLAPFDSGGAGATTSLLSAGPGEAPRPGIGAEGNYVLSSFLENSARASGGATLMYNAGTMDPLVNALQDILNEFSQPDATAAFARAAAYFQRISSSPQDTSQLLLQGLLEAMGGVVQFGFKVLRAFLRLILEVIKAAIEHVLDTFAAPIDIPVVTWLYAQISPGSQLSILELGALVLAAPAAIAFKVLTGKNAGPVMRGSGTDVLSAGDPQKALFRTVHGISVICATVALSFATVSMIDPTGISGFLFRLTIAGFNGAAAVFNLPSIYHENPSDLAWFGWAFKVFSAFDLITTLFSVAVGALIGTPLGVVSAMFHRIATSAFGGQATALGTFVNFCGPVSLVANIAGIVGEAISWLFNLTGAVLATVAAALSHANYMGWISVGTLWLGVIGAAFAWVAWIAQVVFKFAELTGKLICALIIAVGRSIAIHLALISAGVIIAAGWIAFATNTEGLALSG